MSKHEYNSESVVSGPKTTTRQRMLFEREEYGKKLSLIITDQCNILCSHCLPACTSDLTEELRLDEILKLIEDASLNGIDTICFTGGEPFLRYEDLQYAIQFANGLDLRTTIMSNGYWAATEDKARNKLQGLTGLTRIGLSTDVFHQEFVSIEKIINAVRAARDLGLYCAVRLTHLDDPDTEIEFLQHQLKSVAGFYELEHQPVQPMGRAEEFERDSIFSYDVDLACCRSADVHAVNASGRMTACCGASGEWENDHLLDFGDIRQQELREILSRADQNQALHIVRLKGPAGLAALAREQATEDGEIYAVPEYTNMCELCRFMSTDSKSRKLVEKRLSNAQVQRKIVLERARDFGEL